MDEADRRQTGPIQSADDGGAVCPARQRFGPKHEVVLHVAFPGQPPRLCRSLAPPTLGPPSSSLNSALTASALGYDRYPLRGKAETTITRKVTLRFAPSLMFTPRIRLRNQNHRSHPFDTLNACSGRVSHRPSHPNLHLAGFTICPGIVWNGTNFDAFGGRSVLGVQGARAIGLPKGAPL
jgi:hypothetical protein